MKRLAEISLWLVVFTIPWDEAVSLKDVGTLARVFGTVAVCVGFGGVIVSGVPFRRLDAVHFLAVAFVMWGTISATWSVDVSATLGRAATLVRVTGLMWLIWQFAQTKGKQLALMRAYVLGCSVSVGSLLANVFWNPEMAETGRFRGANMNENGLAFLFAISIVCALYLSNAEGERHKASRWLYWLYCPIAGVSVLLTGSRGGLIVLLCGLATLSLAHIRKRQRAVLILAGLMVVAVVGARFVLPGSTEERLLSTGDEIRYGTWSDRRTINRIAVAMFLDTPVLGVGSGAFAAGFGRRAGRVWDAHNTFSAVAVETGVIGFIIFFGIPAGLLIRAQRLGANERATWTTIMVMWLVAGLSSTLDYNKATWFLFGMCLNQIGLLVATRRCVGVAGGGVAAVSDSGRLLHGEASGALLYAARRRGLSRLGA